MSGCPNFGHTILKHLIFVGVHPHAAEQGRRGRAEARRGGKGVRGGGGDGQTLLT